MTDWFGPLLPLLWLKDLSLSFNLLHCLTVSQHTAQHSLCTCRVWQQLYFDKTDIFTRIHASKFLFLCHVVFCFFFGRE